ncbi:MAG TPA: VOC family protein [Chthonomonadales bacterium]|nr:VOC family protein [Chthonomonadales bacterium]
MNPKSFRTAFTVSDMDRSIAFYRDLLGFEVLYDAIRTGPAYEQLTGYPDVKLRIVLMKDAGTEHRLELVQYLQPPGQAREMANHFVGAANVCYFVEDIEQEYQRLQAHGVRFQSAPVEFIRDGKAIGKCVYLYDPDNITVCLFQSYP